MGKEIQKVNAERKRQRLWQARRQFGELADYPYSQIVHLAKVYYKAR